MRFLDHPLALLVCCAICSVCALVGVWGVVYRIWEGKSFAALALFALWWSWAAFSTGRMLLKGERAGNSKLERFK